MRSENIKVMNDKHEELNLKYESMIDVACFPLTLKSARQKHVPNSLDVS